MTAKCWLQLTTPDSQHQPNHHCPCSFCLLCSCLPKHWWFCVGMCIFQAKKSVVSLDIFSAWEWPAGHWQCMCGAMETVFWDADLCCTCKHDKDGWWMVHICTTMMPKIVTSSLTHHSLIAIHPSTMSNQKCEQQV